MPKNNHPENAQPQEPESSPDKLDTNKLDSAPQEPESSALDSTMNTKSTKESLEKESADSSAKPHAHTKIPNVSLDEIKQDMKAKLSGESSRYITAAVLIGVIAALLLWNNPIVIWAVIGAVFILGFREALALYDLEQHAGFYALALALWATSYFVANPIESALVACMILASITAYAQRLSPRAMLPFLYPTLPFLALYSVYKDFGASHIVWLILIIALCDIGAYFGGRLFGKTPLSPTSPKKTLEGVIIGVAVSIVVGSVAGIFVLGTHFFFAIFASLIVAVCGVFGDLYESYLKRQAQVKDSGSILPGHGGILDRFDAVLFGAVGMHFLLIFFNDFACSRCMPLLNLIQ